MMRLVWIIFLTFGLAYQGAAQTQAFIEQAFSDSPPAPKMLWFTPRIRQNINHILGHNQYPGLRVRYWQQADTSVWILEEIGKYKPITAGFVITKHQIVQLQVLHYRESHGWEVQQEFFTRQFIGAHLTSRQKLSSPVDGISGATLSVRALKNLARLALYFDDTVYENDHP